MTKRLKSDCKQQFSVDVLGMQWVKPDPSEARLLHIPVSQNVLLREVYLRCGDKLCVYARSVIPLLTLQGKHRRLKYLGNRPLGEYLFAVPGLQRSCLQWTRLSSGNGLIELSMPLSNLPDKSIWGRRSRFSIDNKSLLVSEFFLPILFK